MRERRGWRRDARPALVLCALVPLLALASPVLAQARVEGRVVAAASGRPVAGALVTLVTLATLAGPDSISVNADANGSWSVRTVRPGRYALRVRALGYVIKAERVDVSASGMARHVTVLTAAVLPLDQMVVTASRRAQRLGDAVQTVELVSRADIERTGASDLASVLLEQTGIELQGGHPAGAGAMLQGFGSERVLVLLDGQPVAGRLSGVFDISRIPASMVERIEVVKGAQSTLYGSEAMGGVVNIITRAPARATTATSATLTAGSQDRRDASVGVAASRGAFSASVDLGRRGTATAPGVESEAGALAARLDGAAKLRWSPDSARHVEVSVLALDERQRWRTGTFYNFGDNSQYGARVGASFARGRHRFSPGAWTSVYDHRSRASTAPMPIAGDEGDRQLQRVHQAELIYNGRFSRSLALDAGAQVRIDEIETERVPGGLRSLTSIEPFVQMEATPVAGVTLLPGLRVTRSSQWGTHVTPRVSARARLTDRLTLRASMGDGFRAPDFKELYMFFQNTSADYAVLGNPDVRPERSRNAMIGAELATVAGFVRAQLFHNRFRDFIETRVITGPGEPPVYQYANVDDGTTRGAELEAGANLSSRGALRLEGGYSYLVTRDEASGRALLGRPSHAARASIGATLPFALRSSLTAIHTGRTPMQRDDASGEVTSSRDAFTRLDVRVARALPLGGTELALGADNVLDRRPAEWAGFTGRHVYATISWNFTRTNDR